MTWRTPETEERPPMRIWSRAELDARVKQNRRAEASLNTLIRHRAGQKKRKA